MRRQLTAVLAVLAIALPPSATRAADMFIRLESAVDLDEIVLPYFETVPRRRFLQSLGVSVRRLVQTPEREVLSLYVYGWLETDFAREVDYDSADPHESEPVDFVLQKAYLDFAPADWLRMRGGRLVLYSPVLPADLDGLSVDLHAPVGLYARVGGGREVRYYVPGVDGDLHDVPGGRWELFDNPKPDTSWLVLGELGWEVEAAQIRAGHRVAIRHGDRVTQLTGLSGIVRGFGLTVDLEALINHLMESPDRLGGQLTYLIERVDIQLRLGWRYLRPTFDGDSIFNVFAVTPWVGWNLGGDWQTRSGFGLSLEGRQRAFATDERSPWSGGFGDDSEEVTRGLSLRGWGTIIPTLRMRAGFSADGGYGGLLLQSDVSALWDIIPSQVDLGLRLGHLYRESDVWDERYGHQLFARGQATYRFTSFGRVRGFLDYISDYRSGGVFRFMAEASFNLGPIW